MGEFNKDQGQTDQTGQQQGDKPAFGQFDKEQGQQDQQGDFNQKGEELDEGRQQEQGDTTQPFEKAGQQQDGDDPTTEKGQSDDQR